MKLSSSSFDQPFCLSKFQAIYEQTNYQTIMISLTKYLDANKKVRAALSAIQPKLSRKIPVPMQVERTTERYLLLGTAFDYLLRLYIKRNIPHADLHLMALEHSFPWRYPGTRVELEEAGYVPYILGEAYSTPELDLATVLGRSEDEGVIALRMGDDLDAYPIVLDISNARNAAAKKLDKIRAYTVGENVPFADVAWGCIAMAIMDDTERSGSHVPLNLFVDEVKYPAELDELRQLFSVIPDALIDKRRQYWLNPVLGIVDSTAEIGADCDIIMGDNLIEIKVVSKNSMDIDMLNQLLGYFFLIRKNRELNLRPLPEIQEVSIYFARHGHLWSMPVSLWLDHPDFENVEKQFWKGLRPAPR